MWQGGRGREIKGGGARKTVENKTENREEAAVNI